MKRILNELWMDDCGALLATEWVTLATIIVIGIIPGLIAIRQGTLDELTDFSNATTSLDQSYEFDGQEILCTEDTQVVNSNGRHSSGGGSITEIVDGKAVRRNTPGVQEGSAAAASQHGKRTSIATTSGSAFVQGNHTDDGSELHSGTRHLSHGRVEPATGSPATADPCD